MKLNNFIEHASDLNKVKHNSLSLNLELFATVALVIPLPGLANHVIHLKTRPWSA